jgi:hypothetical protein
MRYLREALQREQIRRSLIWVGFLVGCAVLLEGLMSMEAWTYVMLLIAAAMSLELWLATPDDSDSGRWSVPIAAGMLVGLAAFMRLLLAW